MKSETKTTLEEEFKIRIDKPTFERMKAHVAEAPPAYNRSDLVREALRFFLDAQDKGNDPAPQPSKDAIAPTARTSVRYTAPKPQSKTR
jgi:Arc/MetJ-type ribon-helix-helix transcriptional regulator